MMRSPPEMAYQDGMVAHAGGPEGVNRTPRLTGFWAAAMRAASLGLRSWAKSARKNAGSMMAEPVASMSRWPGGNGGARNAGGVYPCDRLPMDSPCAGRYAAVSPSAVTSVRPLAALDTTTPP